MVKGSPLCTLLLVATALAVASAFNMPVSTGFVSSNRLTAMSRNGFAIGGEGNFAQKFRSARRSAVMPTMAASSNTNVNPATQEKKGVFLLFSMIANSIGLFFSAIKMFFSKIFCIFGKSTTKAAAPTKAASGPATFKNIEGESVEAVLTRVASMSESNHQKLAPPPVFTSPNTGRKIDYYLYGGPRRPASSPRTSRGSGYYMMGGLSPYARPRSAPSAPTPLYAPAAPTPPPMPVTPPPQVISETAPTSMNLNAGQDAFSTAGNSESEPYFVSEEYQEEATAVPATGGAAKDDVAAILAATQRMMEERAAEAGAAPSPPQQPWQQQQQQGRRIEYNLYSKPKAW